MKASSRCDCDIFGRPGVTRTLPRVAARPVASQFIPWRKKKSLLFFSSVACLFSSSSHSFIFYCIWVLPSFVSQGCLMCLACHVYYSFMRMVVSHTHLFTACGQKPPGCKRERKKMPSRSFSSHCFSSDVGVAVSGELLKALMVIRCWQRRERPGRWKWFSTEPYFIRMICFILCELLRCDDAYTISGLCVRVSSAYHPSFLHQSCVFSEISYLILFSFFEWFLFAFGDLILVITDAEMTYVNLFCEANECYFFICVWRIEVFASYFSCEKG